MIDINQYPLVVFQKCIYFCWDYLETPVYVIWICLLKVVIAENLEEQEQRLADREDELRRREKGFQWGEEEFETRARARWITVSKGESCLRKGNKVTFLVKYYREVL